MFHLVEEYVKDLYIIGLILLITPLVIATIWLVSSILSSIPIAFDFAYITFLSLIISGSSIIGYIGSKYRYKPFGKGEISIPIWPILLLIAAAIVIYLWWRLSFK